MKKNLPDVIILSGPVRSGKTTAISRWISGKEGICGIITPDIGDKRYLVILSGKETLPFETDNTDSRAVAIGKFYFSQTAFEKARAEFIHCSSAKPKVIIADEIGPLELKDMGYEPAFSKVLAQMQLQSKTWMLCIVRETLLDDFSEKYGTPALVISRRVIETMADTCGLVLCGGHSTRMGKTKAMLDYGSGKPQYQETAWLLSGICKEAIIACGPNELPAIHGCRQVFDLEPDQGPAAGVLAGFQLLSSQHLLVCGCDYPLVRAADLVRLMAESEGVLAVCYEDESASFADPLLCFYHRDALPLMQKWYADGNRSLRHFLKTIPHKVLRPDISQRTKSVDTPEDYNKIMDSLHGSS